VGIKTKWAWKLRREYATASVIQYIGPPPSKNHVWGKGATKIGQEGRTKGGTHICLLENGPRIEGNGIALTNRLVSRNANRESPLGGALNKNKRKRTTKVRDDTEEETKSEE